MNSIAKSTCFIAFIHAVFESDKRKPCSYLTSTSRYDLCLSICEKQEILCLHMSCSKTFAYNSTKRKMPMLFESVQWSDYSNPNVFEGSQPIRSWCYFFWTKGRIRIMFSGRVRLDNLQNSCTALHSQNYWKNSRIKGPWKKLQQVPLLSRSCFWWQKKFRQTFSAPENTSPFKKYFSLLNFFRSSCYRGSFVSTPPHSGKRNWCPVSRWSVHHQSWRKGTGEDLLRHVTWRWRMDTIGHEPHKHVDSQERKKEERE